MGSSASTNNETIMETGVGTKLEDLSEGCISEILSRTTPLDASRSALVSKLFHSAAGSDSVWEAFIPSDHPHIIPTSTSTTTLSSKKSLFFSLCDTPILVHHGTKCVRLDKASGKKCYMIGARDLSIAWQDEPEYWFWTSDPNSRFDEVACLKYVFWFDIVGHLETSILSPDTTYAAYLVFKYEHDYGLDQDFKSYVTLVRDREEAADMSHFRRVNLKAREYPRRRRRNIWLSRERGDGWMEIELGDFIVPAEGHDVSLVRMQVKEVEVLGSKSGIVVEGIEVRPRPIRAGVR